MEKKGDAIAMHGRPPRMDGGMRKPAEVVEGQLTRRVGMVNGTRGEATIVPIVLFESKLKVVKCYFFRWTLTS